MVVLGKHERKRPRERPWRRWEDNIKLQRILVECGQDLSVSEEEQIAEFCEQGNEPSCSIKCGGDFLTS